MILDLIVGDLVELVFDDFTTKDDGWIDRSVAEVETPAEIRLVGIYINRDDRVMRIAHGVVLHDGSVCTLSMVPIGMIRTMRKLNVSSEEK